MKTVVIRGLLVLLVLFLAVAAWFGGPAIGSLITKPDPAKTVATSMIAGGALPPGCTCHSKNKNMVSMHAIFGITDCAKCHGQMGNIFKKRSKIAGADQTKVLKNRMKEERICRECHKS